MPLKKKIPRRYFFFLTIFLVVFSIALTSFFLWFLDTAFLRQELSIFLSKKLDTPITARKIDFKLFPLPCVKIDGLDVDIKKKLNVHVEEALVYPDILYSDILNFAAGKIQIKRICFKNVSVLTVGSKGIKEQDTKSPLLIMEGNFFSLLPEIRNDLNIVVENFTSHLFSRLDGSIVVSSREKKITGDCLIKKLKITQNILSELSPGQTISSLTSDSIRARFSYTENEKINIKQKNDQKMNLDINLEAVSPKALLKDITIPEISAKKIKAKAVVTKDMVQVFVSPIVFDSPELTCAIDFAFNQKTRAASLIFKGKNIKLASTRKTALQLLENSLICQELFWILRAGFVPFVSVSFNSNNLNDLFNPEKMVITGSASKASVMIPETKLLVTNIQAGVTMAKGILHTDVTQGKVRGASIQKGTLDVDILKNNYAFEGEFELSSDMSTISQALKELLPDTLLARELDRCDQIQGRTGGSLHLKSDNKGLAVTVNAKEVLLNGSYDRIPGKMQITAKEFTFDNNCIFVGNMNLISSMGLLSNISGEITLGQTSVDQTPLEPETLKNSPVLRITSGSASLEISRLFTWLISFKPIKTSLFPVTSALGKITLDHITIKGPILAPEKLHYSMDGSLADLALGTQESDRDISNAAGKFIFSHEKTLLTDMTAIINTPHLISFITKYPHVDELAMPIAISQGFIKKEQMLSTFNGQLKFQKGVDIFLNIEGRPSSYTLNLANITDKDKTLAQISNKDGMFDFKGFLDTRTLENLLNPKSSLIHELTALTKENHFVIESDPGNNLVVNADFIDLDKLDLDTIKETRPNETQIPKNFFKRKITLKANSLKYRKCLFNQVEAGIIMAPEKTEITIVHANRCAMEFTGSIVIQDNDPNNDPGNSQDDSIDLHLNFDVKNSDLNKTLTCIHGKKDLIKGAYSLKADLQSKGSKDTLAANANGMIVLNSPGGRIYKLTLLSRILSVINISNLLKGKLPDIEQNGFAYETLMVDAKVETSKIILETAVINGKDMTIIFNGWIDPAKDTIDLTFLVAPFKTADILIEKIPILGGILNGRLISIPVKAVGSMDDPDVFLLPPSEVGKGLMGTMQRILEAPLKLIEKIPTN